MEEPPSVSTGQPNWKPLFALVYSAILLVAGIFMGTRPLDIYLPSRSGKDSKAWKRLLRAMTYTEKMRVLTTTELVEKRRSDRLMTWLISAAPFVGAEAAIGLLSMHTGIMRIPEAGSWLSFGFCVNTILLLAGLLVCLAVRSKGYHLSEGDLQALETPWEGDEAARFWPVPVSQTPPEIAGIESGPPSAGKVVSRSGGRSLWGFNPWARFK